MFQFNFEHLVVLTAVAFAVGFLIGFVLSEHWCQ